MVDNSMWMIHSEGEFVIHPTGFPGNFVKLPKYCFVNTIMIMISQVPLGS
jgi:hypothetical protein